MGIQIQKRLASRNYLALIHGAPNSNEGMIVGDIGRHPKDRKKYAVVSDDSGKYACTHWKLIERLGDYSLVKFKLDTGRTHQIRVHCSHIGHPILGDVTYSRRRKLPIEIKGQLLHAAKLELYHPDNNEKLVFEAPLPDIFEKVLKILKQKQSN